MANYQLYRSNVYLGGQMKYDIILGSENNEIYVQDFHMTPISNSVPYNKFNKEDLLKYDHQENISKFYSKISGYFYNDFADPNLTSLYPLIKDGDSRLNYDSTYEMGCRRSQVYQLYQKQFEFFCPLWIEQLQEGENLEFEFQIYSDDKLSNCILKKRLKFQINPNLNQNSYHNKFIQYLNNYLSYIKTRNTENVNDWVLDIQQNGTGIQGVEVSTGLNKIVKDNHLLSNLTSRERPVLETNNMIISELQNNKLICKQLLNFNFCFNIKDLCDLFIIKELSYNPIYIKIDTYVNDNLLELKDFYSNHDFIRKIECGLKDHTTNSNNQVLDYLKDNLCLDLINKNKIIQNTTHWCLSENNSYHFNFYNGFAGILNGNNLIVKNLDTPDISSNIYDNQKNQWWSNVLDYREYTLIDEINIQIIDKIIEKIFANEPVNDIFSEWSIKNNYIKNIHYDTQSLSSNSIYYCLIICRNDIFFNTQIWYPKSLNYDQSYKEYNTQSNKFILIKNGNKYYIISLVRESEQKSFLPLNRFLTHEIFTMNNIDDIFTIFFNVLKTATEKNNIVIQIPFNITPYKESSPSLTSSEISYYKTSKNAVLERQIGKIKPYFIDKNDIYKNFVYYKWNLTDNKWKNKNNYLMYKNSLFLPVYPSIGYYTLNCDEESYDIQKDLYDNLIEYHKFQTNKIINLYDQISTQLESELNENGEYKPIKTIIEDYIINLYNGLSDKKDWILDLYEYKSNLIDTMKDGKYTYNVEIKLK